MLKLRLITGPEMRQCLGMPRAIDLMHQAFAALSQGEVTAPQRTKISSDQGTMLYKPALLPAAGIFVVKSVSVFPGNVTQKLPVTTGILLVNDATTGLPLALMDAEYLTALRTGAAAGLACRLLANPNSRQGALFGTGGQAYQQLQGLLCALPLDEVFVFSRHKEHAEVFCRDHSQASSPCRLIPNPDRNRLHECQVISTATTSLTPVFQDLEIAAGTHINGIGSFMPTMAEVPAETVCRATVIVDQRSSCLNEAGDLRQPMDQGLLPASFCPAELGEILSGEKVGRRSPEELTFFKSVGNAAQDVVCAAEVLRQAEATGIGTTIEI